MKRIWQHFKDYGIIYAWLFAFLNWIYHSFQKGSLDAFESLMLISWFVLLLLLTDVFKFVEYLVKK